jgi:polygalacturonase
MKKVIAFLAGRKTLVGCFSVFLSSLFLVQAEPAQTVFNVRDFGAAGDGKNLDSPAIDRAIDAAAKAGGGTVLVPAGTYLSGSIHLQSNIHLLIDAGAIILGAPQNLNAYDETEPFIGIAY